MWILLLLGIRALGSFPILPCGVQRIKEEQEEFGKVTDEDQQLCRRVDFNVLQLSLPGRDIDSASRSPQFVQFSQSQESVCSALARPSE